jgi:two-component system, chemotaxis family, chemotaxis protein CheY
MSEDNRPVFLIVDDSGTIRKMIMSALRPLDPSFSEAASGLEAIEQLTIRAYDAIFLDLNMPDMHGLEFLRFARSHAAFQSVPIIVVTSRDDEDMRAQVLAAGADRFITKPFLPQDLLEAAQSPHHLS